MILLLSVVAVGSAQTPSNWDNVKALAQGTQIRVAEGTSAHGTSQSSVGTLGHITDNDLVLMQGTGNRSIPRAQIISLSIRKQRHGVRNALIGLGVGTAAGIAIGAGIGEAQARGCQQFLCGLSLPVDAAAGGAIGLVAGTITGIFWPTGWQKVYAP